MAAQTDQVHDGRRRRDRRTEGGEQARIGCPVEFGVPQPKLKKSAWGKSATSGTARASAALRGSTRSVCQPLLITEIWESGALVAGVVVRGAARGVVGGGDWQAALDRSSPKASRFEKTASRLLIDAPRDEPGWEGLARVSEAGHVAASRN